MTDYVAAVAAGTLVESVITAENDPLLIDVAFGSLSPGDRLEAMTALGHHPASHSTKASDRLEFETRHPKRY